MTKRFKLASLSLGVVAAAVVMTAQVGPGHASALAAPASDDGTPTSAAPWVKGWAAFGPPPDCKSLGPGAPSTLPAPPDGSNGALRAALGGEVSAVSGSTYTIAGPGDHSMTVTATSSTVYVKADGSSTDASAVKTGVFVTAEGTPSGDGKTLTAERIIVGAPPDGPGGKLVTGGPVFHTKGDGTSPPAPADGTHAMFAGPLSSVSGSTYTIAGPDGGQTITATSSTTYVKADGSATDASAMKAGVFVIAEGTVSNQGKTLTAQRITIGEPPNTAGGAPRLVLAGEPGSGRGVMLRVDECKR
jgi:hypothetical protein